MFGQPMKAGFPYCVYENSIRAGVSYTFARKGNPLVGISISAMNDTSNPSHIAASIGVGPAALKFPARSSSVAGETSRRPWQVARRAVSFGRTCSSVEGRGKVKVEVKVTVKAKVKVKVKVKVEAAVKVRVKVQGFASVSGTWRGRWRRA